MSYFRRSEFWSMFKIGKHEMVCSKHRSITAAIAAASRCERAGHRDHRIVEASENIPYVPRKRKTRR